MPLVLDATACCDVCMEEYNGDLPAYALPKCGHTLCHECASSVSPASCPLCRQAFRRQDAIKLHADYSTPVASGSGTAGKKRQTSLDEGQFLLQRIAWAFDDPNTDTEIFDEVEEFIHKEEEDSEQVKLLKMAVNTLERYKKNQTSNNDSDASFHEAVAASLNERLDQETKELEKLRVDLENEKRATHAERRNVEMLNTQAVNFRSELDIERNSALRLRLQLQEQVDCMNGMRHDFQMQRQAAQAADEVRRIAESNVMERLRAQIQEQTTTIETLRNEIAVVKQAAAVAEENRRSRKDDIIIRLRAQLQEITEKNVALKEEATVLTQKVAETSVEAKRSRQQDIIDNLRRKNQQQADVITGHEAEMTSACAREEAALREVAGLKQQIGAMRLEADKTAAASHAMEAHLLGRMEEETATSNALKRQITALRDQNGGQATSPSAGSSNFSETDMLNLFSPPKHNVTSPPPPSSSPQDSSRPSPRNPFSRPSPHTRAVTETANTSSYSPVHTTSRSYNEGSVANNDVRAKALLDTVAAETTGGHSSPRNERPTPPSPSSKPFMRFNPPLLDGGSLQPNSPTSPTFSSNQKTYTPPVRRESQSYTNFTQPPHLRFDEDVESPFSSNFASSSSVTPSSSSNPSGQTSPSTSATRVDPMVSYLRPFDTSSNRLFSPSSEPESSPTKLSFSLKKPRSSWNIFNGNE